MARNPFYFERMECFPSLVRRKIIFANIGIKAEEKFAQVMTAVLAEGMFLPQETIPLCHR
ncbi:MAG: hypothetical protein QW566_02335 [Candidatus Jordarchaeales archaeon]